MVTIDCQWYSNETHCDQGTGYNLNTFTDSQKTSLFEKLATTVFMSVKIIRKLNKRRRRLLREEATQRPWTPVATKAIRGVGQNLMKYALV